MCVPHGSYPLVGTDSHGQRPRNAPDLPRPEYRPRPGPSRAATGPPPASCPATGSTPSPSSSQPGTCPPPLRPAARRPVLVAERHQRARRSRSTGRHQYPNLARGLPALHRRPRPRRQPADRRRPRRGHKRPLSITRQAPGTGTWWRSALRSGQRDAGALARRAGDEHPECKPEHQAAGCVRVPGSQPFFYLWVMSSRNGLIWRSGPALAACCSSWRSSWAGSVWVFFRLCRCPAGIQ